MNVLFIDMVAPSPYTANTLRSYAMGGSEASLLRVARGLAALPGFEVAVFQGCDSSRREATIDGIRHVGDDSAFQPGVVVHMRTHLFVESFREAYPKARQFVWLHDVMTKDQCELEPLQGNDIICVSDWHAAQVKDAEGNKGGYRVTRIYNPVVVGNAQRLPKVKGRIGFFSSPHKGLAQVRKAFFDYLSGGRAPDAPVPSLVIANPGYMPDSEAADSGVINLGQLPHHRVLEEMSKCEVLFYPQTVFPETFGLVLAEANAMGTPVLAHNFGAALEVLGGEAMNEVGNAVRNCADPESVRAALGHLLREGFPVVADPRFALDTIIAEWQGLLEGKA